MFLILSFPILSFRKKLLLRRQQKMVVKLQSAARQFLAYRRYKRKKFINDSAKKITKFIRRSLKKRKFHLRFEREQFLGSIVILIQNFFRQRKAVHMRQRMLITRQKSFEGQLATQVKLVHLLAKIQLKILSETITKPLHKRYYVVSKQDCPCYGPLQAIFVMFACGQTVKSRMELSTISLNQLDNSHFLKFLLKIPFFMINQKNKPVERKKKKVLTESSDEGEEELEDEELDPLALNGIHPLSLSSLIKQQNYSLYNGLINIIKKPPKKTKYDVSHLKRGATPTTPKRGGSSLGSRSASGRGMMMKAPSMKSAKSSKNLLSKQASMKNLSSPSTDNQNPENAAELARKAARTASALLTVLSNGDFPLPPIRHIMSPTEFDILYNKSKLETNATNKITYKEFCACLEYLAEIHYHSKDVNINKRFHRQHDKDKVTSPTTTTPGKPKAEDILNAPIPDTPVTTDDAVPTVAVPTNLLEISPTTGEPKLPTLLEEDKDNTTLPTAENEDDLVSEGDHTVLSLEKLLAQEQDKINRKSGFLSISSLTLPLTPKQLFLGDEEKNMNYLLVFLVRYLMAFSEQEAVLAVLSWLERESFDRLIVFIVKIQSVMRMKLAQRLVRERKTEKAAEEFEKTKLKHLITIQAVVRRFLCRCKIKQIAKEIIVKYVPYLQQPYYFNPKTGVKSFSRPKIMGKSTGHNPHDDCYSLAIPEKGLENVINCYQCNYRLAVLYCNQCEDSMCMICYQSLHCKGAKSKHSYTKIPHCSYCSYQIATKSCITCVTHDPPSGTFQASKAVFARGLYCDTCFLHEHDENTKQLENNPEKRANLKRLLMNTQESHLIQRYCTQKIITSHYYELLTTNCEECNSLSASWRCYSCHQIYCHRCLIHLHSINPIFATHKLELLSYYTPKMHKSLLKDLNQIYFNMKWEKLKVLEREKQRLIEHRKAVIIQSFWRMIFYGRRGRTYMQRQRKRTRRNWRLRQKENKEIRSKISYKMKDIVGLAPQLMSDTVEEKVLKKLTIFKRQTARDFIWKNQADWGYYRVNRKIPRKGVPKKGFDVGEIDELLEQARLLGDRIPGRILVKTAEHVFETTCDLSGLVRPGEIIRIKRYLFGVVSVDNDSIRLNRLWRENKRKRKQSAEGESDDEEDDDDEGGGGNEDNNSDDDDSLIDVDGRPKGEIAYRMPTYVNERFQKYYRWQFFLHDLTLGNPLSQVSFFLYKTYSLRMMTFSLYMMRMNKRSKQYDESFQWKAAALRYGENARWISAYFNTAEGLVDLTGVTLTEDLRKKRFGDKSSVKTRSRREMISSYKGDRGPGEEGEEKQDEEEEEEKDSNDGDGERAPLLSKRSQRFKQLSKRKISTKDSTIIPLADDELLMTGVETEEQQALLGDGKKEKPKKGALTKREKEIAKRKNSMVAMIDNLSLKSNRFGFKDSVQSRRLQANKPASPVTTESGGLEGTEGNLRSYSQSMKKLLGTEPEIEHVTIAKKDIKNPKFKTSVKVNNKPDRPWFASKEQQLERREREDRLSLPELAIEADDWRQQVDPITENTFYLNDMTNEMMTTTPRSIHAKRQLEFQNSRNKKSYDDAQKRIQHLDMVTKNRLLISGLRKK
jgi:hypothetical protein